jgi:group I intron endonuclease
MVKQDKIANWVIYKITSPSGRIYVGKTMNLPKRLSVYKSESCKEQTLLYHSLKKYGYLNHIFEVVDEFSSNNEFASGKEIFWIRSFMSHRKKWENSDYKYDRGLNLTDGGDGTLGVVVSEETRKKMSEKKIGKTPHNKGEKMSPEARKYLFDGLKRYLDKNGPWNKGVKKTEEQKRKISESKKGSTYNRGRVHTPESRKKFLLNLEKAKKFLKNEKAVLVFDKNENFLKEYSSIKECSKDLNINRDTISFNLRGITKSRKGYIFKYKSI